jgi:hypothetical protein
MREKLKSTALTAFIGSDSEPQAKWNAVLGAASTERGD